MPLELLEKAKRFFSREKPYDPEAKEEEIRQKRLKLIQQGVKQQAGYVLHYRSPEPKPERTDKQLEEALRKKAIKIASAIIEVAPKNEKLQILAALQSLDPQKDEATKAVYDWLEIIAPRYELPVRNLQQAFFSQLQQEIQPNVIKKDQKLLKRAVVPREEKEEVLSAAEAIRILEERSTRKSKTRSHAA